jgi:hypothetical protein
LLQHGDCLGPDVFHFLTTGGLAQSASYFVYGALVFHHVEISSRIKAIVRALKICSVLE